MALSPSCASWPKLELSDYLLSSAVCVVLQAQDVMAAGGLAGVITSEDLLKPRLSVITRGGLVMAHSQVVLVPE